MLPKLAIGQFNLIGFPVAAMTLFTWCLLLSTVPAFALGELWSRKDSHFMLPVAGILYLAGTGVAALVAIRFCLRSFPPWAREVRVGTAVVSSLVLIGSWAVYWAWREAFNDDRLWLVLCASFAFIPVSAVGLLVHHTVFRDLQHRPSVVYLRAFSRAEQQKTRISDQSILAALFSAAPRGVSVAFLRTPEDRISSWSPWLVGVQGLALRKPLRSAPSFRAPKRIDDWYADAAFLASSAACTVVDVGVWTNSVDKEIELAKLLEQMGNRVIWLYPEVDRERLVTQLGKESIAYRTTRQGARLRLSRDGALVGSAAAIWYVAMLRDGAPASYFQSARLETILLQGGGLLVLLVLLGFVVNHYFTYPSLTRGTHQKLRQMIRAATRERSQAETV